MKAMTATPPMVPTITAIMYFSGEEEEEKRQESHTLNREEETQSYVRRIFPNVLSC